MLRKVLNYIYLGSGLAAGVFLAGIAPLILAQIIARIGGYAFDSTELSGFFMAASTFLGLAYTFRDGGHVRVSLLINRFSGGTRKMLELWCCASTACLMAYVSWRAVLFTMESYEFHDMSPGLMGIPFWIPQTGMAVGLLVLTIALLDATIAVARNQVAGYEENTDAITE